VVDREEEEEERDDKLMEEAVECRGRHGSYIDKTRNR
jgi:hypothetical protein